MKSIFAYLRVSDSTQIEGDGFTRQETACRNYAKLNGMEIADIYREDISGTELNRPVLASLMVSLEQNGHGIKTVIVERLERVARDLMVQETIIRDFQSKGIDLISAAEGPDLCSSDPTRKMVRQLFGCIAEYDKSMLVLKLRAARDRMRIRTGFCEGRHGYADSEEGKSIIRHVKALHRKPVYGRRRTLKEISEHLNKEGIKTLDGHEWSLFRVQQVIN
jgi:DNA invertase Pin-like site-specific DNA recombinase